VKSQKIVVYILNNYFLRLQCICTSADC